MIEIANSLEEIKKSISVLLQLRITLSEKKCLAQILKQQHEGYKLAYVEDNDEVVAVAGFRILECLAYEKFMYIDDLIVDGKNRSKGYGNMLFDFLVKYAEKEGCKE